MEVSMPQKTLTLTEFKKVHNKSGESLLDIAFDAQAITDDDEFRNLAKELIILEDKFLAAFNDRGMELN